MGCLDAELRVMGVTIIMMVSSWNELISLLYFIFIVNGVLSQYKKEENNDEILKISSPLKKIFVYYMFIIFNLVLANQYQFDKHLFAQLALLLLFMLINFIYLFFFYIRRMPRVYEIRLVKGKGQ